MTPFPSYLGLLPSATRLPPHHLPMPAYLLILYYTHTLHITFYPEGCTNQFRNQARGDDLQTHLQSKPGRPFGLWAGIANGKMQTGSGPGAGIRQACLGELVADGELQARPIFERTRRTGTDRKTQANPDSEGPSLTPGGGPHSY